MHKILLGMKTRRQTSYALQELVVVLHDTAGIQ
jgi:hypothetical protein